MTDPQLLTGLGIAASIFFCSAGSAYASVHSGVYAMHGGKSLGFKAFVPIVQSGVLAIYGILVAFLLMYSMKGEGMTTDQGYRNLAAGLSIGLASAASGCGIAGFIRHVNAHIAKDAEVDFRHLVLCLIFMEGIGFYGLVVSLFLIGFN